MTVEKVTACANGGPMSPGTLRLPNSTSSPGHLLSQTTADLKSKPPSQRLKGHR